MNYSHIKQNKDPKLIETIKSDFKQGDFFKKIRKEFNDLKEFFIDSEKQIRLEKMNWLARTVNLIWWMFKSMILKLNPLRRLILLIGIIFSFFGHIIIFDNENVHTSKDNYLGGILILFILMLELKDKLLARSELEAGQKIQSSLLPEQNPNFNGWSIWIYTRSANEVGGDLVDFIKISDNNCRIIIGDVAGKGLKAALMMAKLQATLRALAFDYDSIDKLISKVNEIFYRDTLRNMFASLICAKLNSFEGKIKFVNAGHFPPLLISENNFSELLKGEIALGLKSNSIFTEHTVELKPDDTWIAYSDGVIEAKSEYGTFFGFERFIKIILENKNFISEKIGLAILKEINSFIKDASLHDDISLVIIKKL